MRTDLLLIQDLSGRIPFGLKFQMKNEHGKLIVETAESISYGANTVVLGNNHNVNITDCRPFLFGHKCIENQETVLFKGEKICFFDELEKQEIIFVQSRGGWIRSAEYDIIDFSRYYDFLDRFHIDYRGLIRNMLAIEVTKDNNPYAEI